MRRAVAALAATCLLAACQSTAPTVAVPVPVTQTVVAHIDAGAAADDNLNAVLWVQSAAEYDAAALSLYQAAAARLPEALADPTWDALPPGARAPGADLASLPPAVVMDVDETVLDNSPYQARLVRGGGEYAGDTWAAWVDERAARAVPGVAAFTRAAEALGITIVYVTNRQQAMEQATLDNLRALGLPTDPGTFLGQGTVVPGCEADGGSKDCRRRLVGQRYRVLMQVGDQLGDFVEPADGTVAGRQAAVDQHAAWFGERWWLLPNPTYGGWEPAAFGGDWRQPRAVRRAAKQAALDTAER